MPTNKTPDLSFNAEEMEALYQIIREYQEEMPNEEEYWDYDKSKEKIDKKLIVSILKKVSKNLSKESKIEIDKDFLRAKYHTFNNPINEKAYSIIEKAFDELKTVEINYFNIDSAEFTKRKLDVYYKSRKYIISYCHLRKAIRKFRASRMEKVNLTTEQYKIPKNFDKNKY
ncbi:WYL domain-containing protein [Candidatus Woesearchaeota archaeon]|nr:WYL domain-containing protein [Candidatus Woesearchaeota archaeon]